MAGRLATLSREISRTNRDDDESDQKSNLQNLHIANSDKLVAFYKFDFIIALVARHGFLIFVFFIF